MVMETWQPMKMEKEYVLVVFVVWFFLLLPLVANMRWLRAIPISMTRIIYSSTSDGYAYSIDPNYTVAWESPVGYNFIDYLQYFRIGQQFEAGPFYTIHRAFVFFDTSIIPDDINITSATLSLYGKIDYSDTDFNITIQNGQPTYPHDPIVLGDYNKAYYSGNGGNASTNGFSISGYNNITLTSTGRSWISKTGTTKFCLRSNRDIAGTTPTQNEYVYVWAKEKGEAYAPKLYLSYDTEGNQYILNGAYDEEGTRDGAINVTLYKTTEGSETFELNGTETKNVEATPICFRFDLSYNESRVYYLKDDFEEIYVFKPAQPYYTYYFTVIDYLGVTNGYLESYINVGGTYRVVERWSLSILNRIPFIFSWGEVYNIRLVCDEGTYSWGGFVAKAEQNQQLLIVPGMFPLSYPGLNVTVNAARMNETWIQVNYTDTKSLTDWVKIDIKHRTALTWTTDYTQNNTGNTQQLNWNSAVATVDYVVTITALRDGETVSWSFSCPVPPATTNPWENVLDALGTFPFPAKNVIGFILVLFFFGVFSYYSMPTGCVVGVIIAAFLTYIGWLDLSWNLIALAGAVAIFAVLAKAKREEREI